MPGRPPFLQSRVEDAPLSCGEYEISSSALGPEEILQVPSAEYYDAAAAGLCFSVFSFL
jgi:hypothetical protein